jgi:hypothetical protein
MSACHPPTQRTPLATEPNTPYCPINAVDPSGLRPRGAGPNARKNTGFGAFVEGWAAGFFNAGAWAGGIKILDNGPSSLQARQMKTSSMLDRHRRAYAMKNAKNRATNCPDQSYTDGAGKFGVKEFIDSTIDLNGTQHYVGSARIDIIPNGDGNVTIKVVDVKHLQSLVYQIPYVPDKSSGVFATQEQTTWWVEPAPTIFSTSSQSPGPSATSKLTDIVTDFMTGGR